MGRAAAGHHEQAWVAGSAGQEKLPARSRFAASPSLSVTHDTEAPASKISSEGGMPVGANTQVALGDLRSFIIGVQSMQSKNHELQSLSQGTARAIVLHCSTCSRGGGGGAREAAAAQGRGGGKSGA